MIKEPKLGKAVPDPRDYRELTFKDFIVIQQAAQQVADSLRHPVFLVGSALEKHLPRDIDIAIIIPAKKYELIVGKDTKAGQALEIAFHQTFYHTEPLHRLALEGYKLDIKVCPDNWFKDQPRKLLAKPKEVNMKAYTSYDACGPSPKFGGVS